MEEKSKRILVSFKPSDGERVKAVSEAAGESYSSTVSKLATGMMALIEETGMIGKIELSYLIYQVQEIVRKANGKNDGRTVSVMHGAVKQQPVGSKKKKKRR